MATPPSGRIERVDHVALEVADLADRMMRLFAIALDLPEDWFVDKIDHHMTNLCANWYYPLTEPPTERYGTPRISIPFFHQPDFDAVVECLPSCCSADDPPHHAPVTSGAWLHEKLTAAYGGVATES